MGMNIVLVGMNHKTAPVSLRQRFTVCADELPRALAHLHDETGNGVIVSTCNRTEIYFVAGRERARSTEASRLLAGAAGTIPRGMSRCTYFRLNEEAIRHLHRVAAGLDSMILGETEILGQVRAALAAAAEAGLCDVTLNRLFHSAIRAGRRVHSETFLGQHGRSVSSAAAALAHRLLGDLESRQVLVVGTGEAGILTARSLVKAGAKRLTITNRTYHRAAELAQRLRAKAVPLTSLTKTLADTDIVISASGAPLPLIGKDHLAPIMARRNGRSILLIDIAVPRDVDPEVREIHGVHLYDIDDLDAMCPAGSEEREMEIAKVGTIVEEEVQRYLAWWRSLRAVPTIISIRRRVEAIRQEEVAKALRRLPHLSSRERERIEALTGAIVKKLLHSPLTRVKLHSGDPLYLAMTQDLFGLDDRGQLE
jgi:glutamyl-tRNA reductase